MSEQKALTYRMDQGKWEKFKIALIKKGLSAQQFFDQKVDELIEEKEAE